MFEIVMTVCLLGRSEICAERMSASAEPMTQVECRSSMGGRQDSWAKVHPGLVIAAIRCVPLEGAGAPLSVEEIAPGVFVHIGGIDIPTPDNQGDLANLGFIVGEDAVALIDAGGSRAVGEALYRAVRNVTDKPIRWIILTHMHPDHVLGAEVFAEAGATLIGHEKLDRALRARAEGYEARIDTLIGPEAFMGTQAAFPSEAVADSRTLDLGNRILELRALPTAHTDNDVTVLDKQTGILFTGDLVFDTHIPALDGSLTGWIDVLDRMKGIERIVPGHGKAPLPWSSGAEATKRYLRVLAADTRKAIRNGESISTAIGHIAESERTRWKLFDEFNTRNATAAYGELEWE